MTVPADGTTVKAQVMWHEELWADAPKDELSGPLTSRWIDGVDYMKYEIDGVGIDPDTIVVVEPLAEHGTHNQKSHGGGSTGGGGFEAALASKVKLTRAEQAAVIEYGDLGAGDWNPNLRKGRSPNAGTPLGKTLKALDTAIAKSVLDEPAVLYRGVAKEFAGDIQAGKPYTDKGYTSTTVNRAEAAGFAGDGVVIEIHLPAGAKALPVVPLLKRGGADWAPEEGELLLARNTTYNVEARGDTLILTPATSAQEAWVAPAESPQSSEGPPRTARDRRREIAARNREKQRRAAQQASRSFSIRKIEGH